MNDGEQDYSDIDRWQEQFTPQEGFLPGPESLDEGSYDFLIENAELSKTKNGGSIFRLTLKVLSGPRAGMRLERPTWFEKQESVDSLGGDMVTLGMGANWGRRGKPLSQELRDTVPQLRGVKFAGTRKNGKVKNPGQPGFPNLYINARIADVGAMPPPATLGSGRHTASNIPGIDQLFGQQHPANQFTHQGAAVGNDDDCPF